VDVWESETENGMEEQARKRGNDDKLQPLHVSKNVGVGYIIERGERTEKR